MKGLFGQLERLAESDITVLVHGESGAGKELVARAVHENSQRRKGPFVAVNCAAIPDSLQESELFGHEKGAFTGALERRVGRFEQASGGTLFFDEIGELTPTLQAKLLRVLQERAFHRVGGLAELTTDVRILAATNRNLADEVTAGRFREDLYYRVAVMELHVPPLRAREGDIALLAQMFLEEFDELSGRYAEPRGFEIDALQCLLAYSWPGNVRELQNAMQRASVLADAALVRITDLPATVQRAGTATRLPGDTSQGTGAPAEAEASPIPDMAREAARVHDSEIAVEIQPREPAPDERSVFYSPSYPVVAGPPATVHIPQGTTLAELEEAAVRSAMSRFAANISAAARELGISRSVLYRKLDRYGLRGTQESDGTADSEDVSGSSGGSA
jgi:DNA-binding NtrC family response regulator